MNNSKLLEQIYNTDKVEKKVNVSGGIIFKEQDDEKPALLLIQRAKDDHWPNFFEFPRGKCDDGPNEGLISCLKREIKEETGLDIIPLKFIDKFSYTADEGKRLSTQHNYLCKMKDPDQKIKLSKEHQGFQWITTPGEAEMIVLPEMKRAIIKAFEMIDPDTQIVNYPENDFTPNGTIEENIMNLQEKIKHSEYLVDKYINEAGGAELVNAGAYAASSAAAVSGELRRGYDWVQQKIKERNRKRMIAKQEKEKMKKEKERLAMKNKNRGNIA
jgi:8-oxo-dGTP pyrophosphatase MutT (NUDIX family)